LAELNYSKIEFGKRVGLPGPGIEVAIPYESFKEFHSGRDNICIVIYPKGREKTWGKSLGGRSSGSALRN
jgi:hypothetical protein